MAAPMAMMGKLIQKIQRHETFCAKPAPMRGPATVPTDHTAERMANQRPRSARGTRSVTMTSVRAMMPPPPAPWITRPATMTGKLLARAAMREPIAKRREVT